MHSELSLLRQRLEGYRSRLSGETQTKFSAINPLLELMGYEVSNPDQVRLEVPCDRQPHKGTKVDYICYSADKPVLLVEAKSATTMLTEKETQQLSAYFHYSECSLALLTNGFDYWFYTDSVKDNVMDDNPFFKFSLLNYSPTDASFLANFHSERITQFDFSRVKGLDVYRNLFPEYLKKLMDVISDEHMFSILKELGAEDLSVRLAKQSFADGIDDFKELVANAVPSSHAINDPDGVSGTVSLEELANSFRTMGRKPTSVTFGTSYYQIKSWAEIPRNFLDYLLKSGYSPESILATVQDTYTRAHAEGIPFFGERDHFSKLGKPTPATCTFIGDIFVYTGNAPSRANLVILRVCKSLGIDFSEFTFTYRDYAKEKELATPVV